jgi:hypothetical protein
VKYRHLVFSLLAIAACGFFTARLLGKNTGYRAAAQEVVQKVQDAAKILSQSGEAGLAQFDKTESPWVWKDTYVLVADWPKESRQPIPFGLSKSARMTPN